MAGLATPVLADGFEAESLTLRLPAALSRFATYGDVAGLGGASAGSKWASSINPASVAWEPIAGDLRLAFSPQYSTLAFENGSRLDVCAEAFTWDLGEFGVIQPSLAQVRSNTATTRQGLDFRMDMDYAQVQWAKRFGDDWAFGANLNFTKSETRYDLGPLDLDVSESSGETYGFRSGTLHRPAPRLLAGLVFDYAFSPSRTILFDFMGTGVGDVRVKDTTHQYVLRPGVSYEYAKDSAVYADYQYGAFHDESGHLEVHRFYIGCGPQGTRLAVPAGRHRDGREGQHGLGRRSGLLSFGARFHRCGLPAGHVPGTGAGIRPVQNTDDLGRHHLLTTAARGTSLPKGDTAKTADAHVYGWLNANGACISRGAR